MLKKEIKDKGTAPRLEIRDRDNLYADELEKLKKADLFDMGNIQSWTAIGTNKQLAYATHGAMRFFGKFPPPIATHLIQSYTNKKSIIIDPMAGSGTTAVECLLMERRCKSFDVNPLMLLLARVKTTYIDQKIIDKELKNLIRKYLPVSFKKNKDLFIGLKDPNHWFLEETLNSLLGIKMLIKEIDCENLRNFFMVCLLSIIRRVSRATTQQGRLFLDINTAEKDAFQFFLKKANALKISVNTLPKSSKKIIIEERSLIDTEKARANERKADLIILHPPYFNAYKYSSVTSLETYWMEINHADIRKNEIREFFKVGKPENYEKFVEDMSLCLKNALLMLKPGGRLGFMMGDTVIKGQYIPVMRKTLDKANVKKKDIEIVALRVPKYTEASWATSQRRLAGTVGVNINDFIIVIKK